ncbi:MAG TPA: alpha/beta hydrolase [Puia sp.]|nr:alpha/beta hydrolase [Puia sp.]
MKTYFISGIGADYRLFTHIRLPEGFDTGYVHWIAPEPEETLPSYARRLAAQIDTGEPYVLVGFSLGGMMAVEIAKQFPPVCTILISSIPVSSNLPPYYRRAHRLQLQKLASPTLIKVLASLKHLLTMRSRDNYKLIRDVIWAGDDRFIAWAMDAVVDWQNDTVPQPLFHIHGTWDEVLPIRFTKPTHIIPRGGHNLVLSHAPIINNHLREILSFQPQFSPLG